jgi:hypothetical protein
MTETTKTKRAPAKAEQAPAEVVREPAPTDNRRHWDKFFKTNPEFTKPFQRKGGFKGTAIAALYSVQRMTEHFGPVGLGWGITAPKYTTVTAGLEMLVYCEVGVWYRDGDGQRSEVFPGIGGDYIVSDGQKGPKTDDEAFKKAFTDALTNALKLLGMSGDVYMGLFDDNKYVQDRKAEFEGEEEKKRQAEEKAAFEASPEHGWSVDFLAKVEACKDVAELDDLKTRQVAEFRRLEAAGPLGKKRALYVANQVTHKRTQLAGVVVTGGGDKDADLEAEMALKLADITDLDGLDELYKANAERIRASARKQRINQMFSAKKAELVKAEAAE